jgi:hypothetical protein
MSAKTKIVVLHRKELICTAAFCLLGILLIILLALLFLPGRESDSDTTVTTLSQADIYVPGIYSTELVLGENSVNLEVVLDETGITSVQLTNLTEDIATMYPLLEPALETIRTQLYEGVAPSEVSYSSDTRYTSLVLLEAIENSLSKAEISSGK